MLLKVLYRDEKFIVPTETTTAWEYMFVDPDTKLVTICWDDPDKPKFRGYRTIDILDYTPKNLKKCVEWLKGNN